VPLAAVLGLIGFLRSETTGLAAAAIAGFVGWFSACLALAAVYLGQRFKNPIAGILGSMIFRMGLPLTAGLAIQNLHAPLAQAGCFLMILAVYLAVLVVETWLSLRLVRQADASTSMGTLTSGSPSVAGGISGR
jgi:hypothetical protein